MLLLPRGAHIHVLYTGHDRASTSWRTCAVLYVISAVNIVFIYKPWGKSLNTPFALSPHYTPSGSLASHSICSPSSVIFRWQVTLTLRFTSCNSRATTTNSYTPNTQQNPTPGITWNSCCRPCPRGARRATHRMWSALIFHGQVQSTVLVRLQKGLHKGNSTPVGFLWRIHKTPHRCQVCRFTKGIFCGIHSPPTWFHFSKSEDTVFTVQRSTISASLLQYTYTQISPHLHLCNPDRKVMTNLDSVLKSITLPTKVCLVKTMIFPVVMYGSESWSWTIKKAERRRIDAFELRCWRRLFSIPWITRRSNQSILKEISPEYYWKDWCWSWNYNTLATWCEELTHLKRPWYWERLKVGGEGDDRG